MRKGLESTNQTRANKHKRGPKDKANKCTKHNTTQIPTLSPPLASRRQKRQRGHLHTRGGSGREVIPLLLVLLVRLSGGDSLLEVIL